MNAPLVRYAPSWIAASQFRSIRQSLTSEHGILEGYQNHVVLCGFGRVGSIIGQALDHFQIPYIVIERDPDIVRDLRRRGTSCLYGDAPRTSSCSKLLQLPMQR